MNKTNQNYKEKHLTYCIRTENELKMNWTKPNWAELRAGKKPTTKPLNERTNESRTDNVILCICLSLHKPNMLFENEKLHKICGEWERKNNNNKNSK